MNRAKEAPVHTWLAMPMEPSAHNVIERVRRAEDVVHVAVMPDVHLAGDVCVGTAMATRRLIYPSAVGGDIGCGMLAVAFDGSADILRDPAHAGSLLRLFGEKIPWQRRNRACTLPFSSGLNPRDLSNARLASIAEAEGKLQFGTLGGGNHFIEMQADEDNRLWLMIHSGSRTMGQEIAMHHKARAKIRSGSMKALELDSGDGLAYLHDHDWARRFADGNRRAMAGLVVELVRSLFKIETIESMAISCDHNHVLREEHFGELLLIHRKGAMAADVGSPGVIPGSMGTCSYHVLGRGIPEALRSSAHGAGRLLSRNAARQRFGRGDLERQMRGIWFDCRLGETLREESPRAYKDLQSVMRAQGELVRTTRILKPLLVYKGR